MAANSITLNAGSGGAALATDDAAAAGHVQIVKLAVSTAGSATALTADNTNGLLADVKRVQGTVTVAGGAADGAAVSGNPVRIAGSDGTNTQDISTTTGGHVHIHDGGNSITVDGPLTDIELRATAVPVNIIAGQTGVAASSGVVGATTQRVVLATDVALPAGSNAIGKLAANSGVDIGDVDVTSIAAGVNLIGDVGLQPRTSGGLSIHKTLDLDESEEEVKATGGQVYAMHVMNLTNALLYLKFYNDTAANVIVGTTVPVMTIPIPGNNDTDGAGFTWSIPQGIAFSTAICAAVTTGLADNDTGAPAVNACVATILYK